MYRRFARCFIAFSLVGAICAGCAILSSKTIDQLAERGESPNGVFYSLPMALVDVALSVNPDTLEFSLDVGDPQIVPDPRHQYYLRYQPLPNYHDQINVVVNSKTFVTKVHSTSDDRTKDIIVNVAKAFAALGGVEAGEAPSAAATLVLGRVPMNPGDPGNPAEVSTHLKELAKDYLDLRAQRCDELRGEDSQSGLLDDSKKRFEKQVETTGKRVSDLQAQIEYLNGKSKSLEKGLKPPETEPAPGGTGSVGSDHPPPLPSPPFDTDVYYWCAKHVATKEAERKASPDYQKWEEANAKLLVLLRDTVRNAQEIKELETAIGKLDEKLGEITCSPNQCLCESCVEAPPKGETRCVGVRIKPKCAFKVQGDPDSKLGPYKETYYCKSRAIKEALQSRTAELNGAQTAYDKAIEASRGVNSKTAATKGACDRIFAMKSKPPAISVTVHDYQKEAREEIAKYATLETEADCTRGLCYRPKEPFRVDYEIDALGQTVAQSKVVEVPNSADPIEMDIRRAFFVKKVHEIAFDNDGFLQSVHVEKPSELVAISSLPVAIISAIADGIPLRIKLLQDQVNLAKADLDLQRLKGGIETAANTPPAAATESASVGRAASKSAARMTLPPLDAGEASGGTP